MDLKLTGKTALVTGASRGIGRNIERVWREHGFDRAQAIAFLLSSHDTTIGGGAGGPCQGTT